MKDIYLISPQDEMKRMKSVTVCNGDEPIRLHFDLDNTEAVSRAVDVLRKYADDVSAEALLLEWEYLE